MTLQLPAEQITPSLKNETNTAIQRYCSDRITSNRLRRGLVMQRARRQFTGAVIGTMIALLVIIVIWMNPFGLLPEVLRGVLTVLAAFAIAVLIFDFMVPGLRLGAVRAGQYCTHSDDGDEFGDRATAGASRINWRFLFRSVAFHETNVAGNGACDFCLSIVPF